MVTLDADSLLVPGYIPRLLALMEAPGNERVAVAQTPYSAIPDAPTATERVAGATTDVQYLVHQGFTRFGATFWVGANALIRWEALRHLEATEVERGFPVRRFIHDRTVIEDTESRSVLGTSRTPVGSRAKSFFVEAGYDLFSIRGRSFLACAARCSR